MKNVMTNSTSTNITIRDEHNKSNKSYINLYKSSLNVTNLDNQKTATTNTTTNNENLIHRMIEIGANIVARNGNLTSEDAEYIKFERRNINYDTELPVVSDCQCSNMTSSCYKLSKYLNQSNSFNHTITDLKFFTNYSVLVYLCNDFGCGRGSQPTIFLSGKFPVYF